MGTDHRDHAVKIAAVLLAALLSGGCSHASYEKITAAETVAETASDIVLETESETEFKTGSETEPETDRLEENPEASDSVEPADGSMTILFSGDVLLSDHVLNAYSRAGGISGVLDQGYLSAIQSADYFAVNEEFPFSSRGTQAPDKQYTFRLAPEKVSLFKEMGIDAVTLANNHALDYGTDALLDTCEILDQAGILHTGAGKDLDTAKQPVLFEKNGQRVALIGATRVIPKADWAATKSHPGMLSSYEVSVEPLLAQIAGCHASGDKVVVLIHWGLSAMRCPRSIRGRLPDAISMQEQIWSSEAIRMCCRASSIIKESRSFTAWAILSLEARFRRPCWYRLHLPEKVCHYS